MSDSERDETTPHEPDAGEPGGEDSPETPAEGAETPWADTGAETGAETGTEAAAGGDGPAESDADPLAAALEDAAQLKDQLLRTLADMENLRQRTAREIKDARAYAIANFARDVLTVSDNLHRALEALPESERAGADPALTALLQGVEMTDRELQNTLEKHQVRRIEPIGERFDPNFHQAMFEVPDPEVPSGQVVQMVQAGYVIGERVLRPAMVGVSKGGPKMEPGSAPRPEDQAGDTATEEEAAPAPGETGPAEARAEPAPPKNKGPRPPGSEKVGIKVDKSA